MKVNLAAIPRVPTLGVLGAGVVGGASLAALTESQFPRTKAQRKMLAIGGGVMGGAAAGVTLGALRLGKTPLGAAYHPVRTALTGAAVLATGVTLASHWSPGTQEMAPRLSYEAKPGQQVIESLEQQQRLPAKPGTSDVGRTEIGNRGMRFLDTIMTGLPETPVRAYASVGNGATPEERVDFAIARMKELGAFEKSRIIIAQPTGSGFVNQVPIQAAEMLAGGDVATVAAQYGEGRSLSVESIKNRGMASDQFRLLAAAVKEEIAKLPEGERPEVYIYGESLGGWGQQDAMQDEHDFEELGIERALWIGTPGPSHWDDEDRLADESMRIVGKDELDALDHADIADDVKVLGVDNANDTVTKIDPRIAYDKPDWMSGDDELSDGAWIPGITLLQTAFDTQNAIEYSQPGNFGSTYHEYRDVHARAVQLAFGFDDVSDERLQKMTDRMERLEQEYFATHPFEK